MSPNDEPEPRRFSDHALEELRIEFRQHLETFKVHEEKEAEWRAHQSDQLERIVTAQERNTQAIANLAQSAAGVIQLYNDMQGAANIGRSVEALVIWLAKLGAVGAFFGGIVWFLLDKFKTV